ncbi:hypothetical protein GCM10017706_28660 [Lactococcus lactis subsp. hordniae]
MQQLQPQIQLQQQLIKTFSDLLAAHPYVLAGTKSNRTQLVHLLMTVDQTTITSNSTSGQHVNPATNYIPSSEMI